MWKGGHPSQAKAPDPRQPEGVEALVRPCSEANWPKRCAAFRAACRAAGDVRPYRGRGGVCQKLGRVRGGEGKDPSTHQQSLERRTLPARRDARSG